MFTTSSIMKQSLRVLAFSLIYLTPGLTATETVITQMSDSDQSYLNFIAADNNNNATALIFGDFQVYTAYSANGTPWPLPTLLSTESGFKVFGDLAMDATGNALAIWSNFYNSAYTMKSAYFSNGSWVNQSLNPTIDPLPPIGVASVAMNGFGKGLAIWGSDAIYASFFSEGVWSPNVMIGSNLLNGFMIANYSANGHASALWSNFNTATNDNSLYGNTYNGTVWAGFTTLDISTTSSISSGIDANGNTIAIWASVQGINNIVTSRFDGSSWSPQVTLSTDPLNNHAPQVSVNQDGTAVASWINSAGTLFINLFNGTTWSSPIFVAASVSGLSISADSAGNTIIGWVDSGANQIFTAILPKGSAVVGPPTLIVPPSSIPLLIQSVALSNNASSSYVGFFERSGAGPYANAFASVTQNPPFITGLTISGMRVEDKFASQTDRINAITWTPSSDPTTFSYTLKRNGHFLASIPAIGPYVYYDHNRTRGHSDNYTLTAVNSIGTESTPVSVTIR